MPHDGPLLRIRFRDLLIVAMAMLAATSFAQEDSERRIVVGGLNAQSHFVYRFKSERPLIHVVSDTPKLPKTIRLTNRSGRTLKVQIFNGGDTVRLIPRSTITLENGRSHSLPFRAYSARVFEVGLLDKLVTTSGSFLSDTEIRARQANRNRSYVLTSVRHPFSVRNETKETLEVSVFNRGDSTRAIPRFVLVCPPEKTTRWTDPPSEPFRIRLHPHRALSLPLSTDREVNAQTLVTVQSQEWSPWKTLMRQKIVNGRIQESDEPLVFPTAGNLTVDPVAWTRSGSSSNRVMPALLGRLANGKLYTLKLEDGAVSDGMVSITRSTDWRLLSTGDGDTWSFGRFESTPWLAKHKYLFARGRENDLVFKPYYRSAAIHSMNENGSWQSLGGTMTGRPSAVAFGDSGRERFMAFVRHAVDGSLSSRTSNLDGSWGAWQDLGGAIIGDPGACALITGSYSGEGLNPVVNFKARIHAFARGRDGSLMSRQWDEGEGWKPWASLGGSLTSAPYVQSENIVNETPSERTYRHRIHVTAKGPEGETLYRSFDGSKWSPWKVIGPALRSDPIVFASQER